jgi:hypothetical protein
MPARASPRRISSAGHQQEGSAKRPECNQCRDPERCQEDLDICRCCHCCHHARLLFPPPLDEIARGVPRWKMRFLQDLREFT